MTSILNKVLTKKKEPEKEKLKKEVKGAKKDKEQVTQPIVKGSKEQLIQAYRVIKEPHITEKANFLAEQNKYVFKVFKQANKVEVKKAVEALYGVKVERVHMIHSAAKRRRLGRHEGWRQGLKKGFKKAVVTLKQGDKIELLPR